MRVVGIDPGTRRVGVAVSDSGGRVATPHGVFDRTGDDAVDRAALVALIGELEAEMVILGLPLSLDGSAGPAARGAMVEADALRGLLDIPLELHDERLSTVTARRSQLPGQRRSARRRPVDGQAAAVMLQSWLDGTRQAAAAADATRTEAAPSSGGPATGNPSTRNGLTA